jgi:hypothetical protein
MSQTEQASTPKGNRYTIDQFPENRDQIVFKSTDERIAIYLNSIRKMLIFFVVLAAVGIIVGIILGIVDINAVHNAQQAVPTFGD